MPVSPSKRSVGRSVLQRGDVVVGGLARTHATPARRTSKPATAWRRGPLNSLIDACLLVEVKGSAVDAIAHPRGIRAVVEDVPEVGTTVFAHHLCPAHTKSVVRFGLDRGLIQWLEETRPAATGLELGLGREEWVIAHDAPIDAIVVAVPVLAGERALGPFLLGDVELLGR